MFLCFLHFFLFLLFLVFFFLKNKINSDIWSKVLKSPNTACPNDENCNNVCGVGEIILKVEYSNTKSIVNALKPMKELFGVI